MILSDSLMDAGHQAVDMSASKSEKYILKKCKSLFNTDVFVPNVQQTKHVRSGQNPFSIKKKSNSKIHPFSITDNYSPGGIWFHWFHLDMKSNAGLATLNMSEDFFFSLLFSNIPLCTCQWGRVHQSPHPPKNKKK